MRKNTKDDKKSSSLRNEQLVLSYFPACYTDNKPARSMICFQGEMVSDSNWEMKRVSPCFSVPERIALNRLTPTALFGVSQAMKTWATMYALIWLSFLQIFLIVFLLTVLQSVGFYYDLTIGLHIVIGIAVIFFAVASFRMVRKTECPDRIKRITKTTAVLGGVQGALGIILFTLMRFNSNTTAINFVLLLHVVTALAIISQASSSATAFDMWEEKEFEIPAAMQQ